MVTQKESEGGGKIIAEDLVWGEPWHGGPGCVLSHLEERGLIPGSLRRSEAQGGAFSGSWPSWRVAGGCSADPYLTLCPDGGQSQSGQPASGPAQSTVIFNSLCREMESEAQEACPGPRGVKNWPALAYEFLLSQLKKQMNLFK